MLGMTTGNRTHPALTRGNDLYETPPVGTRALCRLADLPCAIWEPCCGRGAIVDELAAHAHKVVAHDLIDYGHGFESGVDFLSVTAAPDGVTTIVTNPPYMYVEDFLSHALELCPEVYFLLRVGFLAGQRWNSRQRFSRHLDRSWIFAPRLPMMHRDGWQGEINENPAIDFAWYRFERDINKSGRRDARIRWADWREWATETELAEIKERRRLAAKAKRERDKLKAAA